jgi:ABC-type nitrate/sulfonate/bicarbonate transport system permease component
MTTRAARRARDRVWSFVGPLVLVVVFLLAWQWYASTGGLGPDVLPSPSDVASHGWAVREDLWSNTIPTLKATALGFALSLSVGFVLSVLIDLSGILRRSIMPLLIVTQTLPLIAIAPLMILWFGFGPLPKVLIVALVTFVPITVSLVEGYASTDATAMQLLRTMGAGRWRTFWMLRLPSASTYFFGGLRIAITYAVVAAIFAEYAGATEGLGIYMQNAKNSFRTDLVLAAVAVSAFWTLLLFGLTFLVERAAVPWVHLQRKAAASA